MLVAGFGGPFDRALCYAIVLPDRKSVFRAGFRPASSREMLACVGPETPAHDQRHPLPSSLKENNYVLGRFSIMVHSA